jgi:hypothetical protein
LTELEIETRDGMLHFKGKIHKGIDIPFEAEGPLSTDGTMLVFHAQKIKAEHIPLKGLLNTIGMHLASLLQSDQVNGITAKDDTLIFDPSKIAHVRGNITTLSLTTKGMAISFGNKATKRRK